MIYWEDEQTVQHMQEVLIKDEIVLASGDTVLGLWGNITLQSFQRLNHIKQRHDKPYLIAIASAERLSKFIDQSIDDTLQTLIETCWPGPVTLVFKARSDLPRWMVGQDETIALRVPEHEELLTLLGHFDGLFSTSANVHSKPIPDSIAHVDPYIIAEVGLVCVSSGQLVYPQNPSTILDCSSGEIKVLRPGAFSVEALKDLLG